MGIRKYSASELKGIPLKHWGPGKVSGNLDPNAISGKRLDVVGGVIESWGVWEASPDTRGVWCIVSPVRKLYMLFGTEE